MGGGGEIHAPPKPDYNAAAPMDAANEGRTGYGELSGELRSMYSGDVAFVNDFPPNMTKLEKFAWYNYQLEDEYPSMVSNSASDNRRVWQQMEVERMFDHHPPHEVHASDLPNYHFWPGIQNELNHKRKKLNPNSSSCGSGSGSDSGSSDRDSDREGSLKAIQAQELAAKLDEHRQDSTDVPRFFKTGIPKTPLQEQDHFVPLMPDGRFDWKANVRKNGYTASLFSRSGWERRFEVPMQSINFPLHLNGFRQFCQLPTYFRHFELPVAKRVTRAIYGSHFDRHAMVACLYLGGLLYMSCKDGHWKKMNWVNEVYNYDVTFMQNQRNKGGFHGVF